MAANKSQLLESASEIYKVGAQPEEVVLRLDEDWIRDFVIGTSVLEMGSGEGVVTQILQRYSQSLHVVEGSKSYCDKLAVQPWAKGITITNSLFESYAPSAQFSDIVAARILEIVDDPAELIRRASQWLSPGGRIHVVVQNAHSLHRRIGVAMGFLRDVFDISQSQRQIGNQRIFSRDDVLKLAQVANLKVVELKGIFLKPMDYASMAAAGNFAQLALALNEVAKEVPDDLRLCYYGCFSAS